MADTDWKWLNSTLYIHPVLRRVLDTCLQPRRPANQGCGSLKVTNIQLEQGEHMIVTSTSMHITSKVTGWLMCVQKGGDTLELGYWDQVLRNCKRLWAATNNNARFYLLNANCLCHIALGENLKVARASGRWKDKGQYASFCRPNQQNVSCRQKQRITYVMQKKYFHVEGWNLYVDGADLFDSHKDHRRESCSL